MSAGSHAPTNSDRYYEVLFTTSSKEEKVPADLVCPCSRTELTVFSGKGAGRLLYLVYFKLIRGKRSSSEKPFWGALRTFFFTKVMKEVLMINIYSKNFKWWRYK